MVVYRVKVVVYRVKGGRLPSHVDKNHSLLKVVLTKKRLSPKLRVVVNK